MVPALQRYHRAPGFLRRNLPAQPPATLTLGNGREHTAETIFALWARGKSEHTVRAYQQDVADFALYFSRALHISPPLSTAAAMDRLFKQSAPSAHEIVFLFREYLTASGLAPASVNRHLATLRSLSKLGRMLGAVAWQLEVPGVKPEKRRSTAGPALDVIRRMLAATAGDTEAETRDRAIVTVFACMGLRAGELCSLDLADLDRTARSAWIRGKGRRERELVPLPEPVIEAIDAYLTHRGASAGPLFRALRQREKTGRLTTRSVLRIVRELGQRVGAHVWCHGLRHTAITTAIERGQRAGIGLDQIRTFSRHRSIATMLIYRDEHDRTTTQRTLTDVVANAVSEG